MLLISNTIQAFNHLVTFSKLFNDAENIFIAVAFLKNSGVKLFEKHIIEHIEKGKELTIVCGLDFFQTDPNALKYLNNLTKSHNNLKLLIQEHSENKTFHPKMYVFFNKDKVSLIVGSANFTNGGFTSNFEISLYNEILIGSEEYTELINTINTIKNLTIICDEEKISTYTRKYQIYKRNEKSAIKKSQEEEKLIFTLNTSLIQSELAKYFNDNKEQENYLLRKKNYIKAKEILEIIRTQNIDNEIFYNYYEALVGKEGQKSLWHSGSLFRAKAKVKKHHLNFKEMLNEIHKNLNNKPDEILSKTIKFFKGESIHKVKGIGINVVSEIFNTYAPEKFTVLNQNPIKSLKYFGYEDFPHSQSFKPNNYKDFNNLIFSLMNSFNLESPGQVDHFLNYIYWGRCKIK